jgi:UDP-galactopyranose mutase
MFIRQGTSGVRRYLSDPYQALPAHGYTKIFENMIMTDPNITVRLNLDFFALRDQLPKAGLTVRRCRFPQGFSPLDPSLTPA